jgi:hypothetical protein
LQDRQINLGWDELLQACLFNGMPGERLAAADMAKVAA